MSKSLEHWNGDELSGFCVGNYSQALPACSHGVLALLRKLPFLSKVAWGPAVCFQHFGGEFQVSKASKTSGNVKNALPLHSVSPYVFASCTFGLHL